MNRLNNEERELKIVEGSVKYWEGFRDALEAIQKKTIDIDKQMIYAEDMIVEYRDRLKKLRKSKRK